MLTKNNFKKVNTSFLEISKKKILIGLFLAVFLSLIFYAFLKLFRKLILVFDALQRDYELFLVPEGANQFYNFLFAFIAVYFAFSIVFVFLLDSPKQFLSKYNYKKKAIINQQRLTNWVFLNWFSRIGTLICLLALDYEGYNLYSDNKHILILFTVAFFGQIWMSIRIFFQKNKLKWFVIVLFITFSFSFGVSKINILDNNLIDKSIMSKNVLYKHNVHVVTSKASIDIIHRSLILDIIIPNNNDKQGLIVDGKKIDFKNFKESVLDFWMKISEAEVPYVRYVIYVDKNADLKLINIIKKQLTKLGGRNLYYATKVNTKAPFYYKSHKGLRIHLQKNIPYNKTNESKEVTIKIQENGIYYFEGKQLNKRNLSSEIKTYFKQNGVKSIRILFNENTLFYNYFQVLENSKKVVDELRNEYSQKKYAVNYLELNRNQKMHVRKKFPWQIIDDIE